MYAIGGWRNMAKVDQLIAEIADLSSKKDEIDTELVRKLSLLEELLYQNKKQLTDKAI